MICSIAGNFEAGSSLNLAVTAVVGQHLRVTVHCYSRANGRNIVGCYMLRPFSHPVAMLLRVFGSCRAKFEIGQTFSP